jgi:hypothetical protein
MTQGRKIRKRQRGIIIKAKSFRGAAGAKVIDCFVRWWLVEVWTLDDDWRAVAFGRRQDREVRVLRSLGKVPESVEYVVTGLMKVTIGSTVSSLGTDHLRTSSLLRGSSNRRLEEESR